ncbi:MAG: ice-binding family protein, partial [bacterium]|nr:ice-binding family protein [bacterium]
MINAKGVPDAYSIDTSVFNKHFMGSEMTHFTTLGKRLAYVMVCLTLFVATNEAIAATAPNLRTTASYGAFSGAGAIGNTGLTVINGDIGTHVGAFTGFPPGIYTGVKNVANAATLQAKDDVTLAYNSMNDATNSIIFDEAIGATMGNGQVLTAKTYRRGDLTTISGTLTFDAQGDPNAIFVIKIGAALNVAANTTLVLANGARAANIYWAVDGAVSILNATIFKGTIIANGAIHLYGGSNLEGRALSVVGAITFADATITVPTNGAPPPPPPPPPPGASLIVIRPAQGEVISGCTQNYQITWSGSGIANSKTLEYSIDSGATWRVIGGMNSSAMAYSWNVPDVTSTRAFVRVTDANNLRGTSGLFSIVGPAQVTGYTFSATTGAYAEISGGTVHATGTGIGNTEYALALPFNFMYHGVTYPSGSNIGVNSNGYVTFATGYAGMTAPLTELSIPVIAGFANYLTGNTNGELRSESTGSAGNRILTIQWKNFTRGPMANASNDVFNFQIKMFETGRVEIVYGAMVVNTEVGGQIGISRFCTRMAVMARATLSPWDRPTITTAASNIESIASPTWVPGANQVYAFIPRVAQSNVTDAGALALLSPAGKFAANQTQVIQVRIKNWGTNNLDSVTVNWSIDGVVKVPVRYYSQPGLAPFAEATVNLGFATFATNSFSALRVWTTVPNGGADAVPGNDAIVRYLAPRVGGTFDVAQGSGNPNTFSDFWSIMRHLRVSGIFGDVTIRANGDVTYDGQLYLAPIDNAFAGGRISIVNRAPATPSIQFQPIGSPTLSYGLYEDAHAAVVIEGGGAPYTLNGLTVRLPNGTNAGGFVYGAANWLTGVTINNLRILNSNFVGPDNWATMTLASDAIYLNNGTGTNNEITRSNISSFPNGIRWDNRGGANTKVLNNTVRGARFGAYVDGGSAMEISGNTFAGTSVFNSFVGISAYSAGTSTITNNRVSTDLTLAGSNATGIIIVPITGATFTVTNNMIAIGSATTARGFDVQANNGGLTRLYHNTVHITGTGGANNVALFINSTLLATPSGVVHSVNNIYSNAGTGANGGYLIRQDDATIVLNATTNSLAISDFNDLYTTGANIGLYDGVIVAKSPNPNPLAAWRLATSRDYNSVAVPVIFVGGSDLHLLTIQQALGGTTLLIPTVPTDIDGDPRVKPYMGADEITPKIEIIQQPQSRYACLGESFNFISIADVTPGASVIYQWYKDGVKLVGRTSAILPFTGVGYASGGVYTAIVTASDGTTTVTAATLPAVLIVVRPTQITEQPASKPVALGSTVNLEGQAEAVGSPTDF